LDLIHQLKKDSGVLMQHPINIDDYISHSKYLHSVLERMEDFSIRYAELKDMVMAMDMNGITMDDACKNEFDNVLSELGFLRETVSDANDMAETNRVKFIKDLKQRVRSVDSLMVTLKA
jgi:hypothetical protein